MFFLHLNLHGPEGSPPSCMTSERMRINCLGRQLLLHSLVTATCSSAGLTWSLQCTNLFPLPIMNLLQRRSLVGTLRTFQKVKSMKTKLLLLLLLTPPSCHIELAWFLEPGFEKALSLLSPDLRACKGHTHTPDNIYGKADSV